MTQRLRHLRMGLLTGLCGGLVFGGVAVALADESAALEHFEKAVRPLLIRHCYDCHSHQARRLEANLYLDSRAGMLKGGDSGEAIVPGEPDKSRLIEAVRFESYEMPPKGKLPDAEIQALVDWIQKGAPWPQETPPTSVATEKPFDWKERRQSHWCWQPVQANSLPEITQKDWPRQPPDHFILSRLEAASLRPAPAADARTWLRRVYFDLIGLPPSPEQIETFLADESPQARERVVNELLQSPHFGEKWARHWMDLVRYAETYGHEFDFNIPQAFQYRDYLIRAFNADVPYAQLVREQIAGDLLETPRRNPDEGYNESILGTGFWFLGEAVHAPTSVRGDLSTRIENQIDVFSRAFLGLSVACARCHDHKFDAISKEDYYGLYGILNSSHRDLTTIDPQGRIAACAAIDQQRHHADQAFRRFLQEARPRLTGEFTAFLPAASDVLEQLSSGNGESASSPERRVALIQNVAVTRQLNPALLARWITAFQDPLLSAPTHPLFPVAGLLGLSDAAIPERKKRLASDITALARAAEQSRQQAVLFENLAQKDWSGWQTSGPAFDTGSVTGLHMIPKENALGVALPGTAGSHLRSDKLHGAWRSPLFTLKHPFLHYRIRAQGATVRLVSENYFMDHFQPLLFRGMTRKDIDTQGEWKWITQGEDIQNHLGTRAYLEILDPGEGSVEIDEIWFSDSATPPVDGPSPFAVQLTHHTELASSTEVANACREQLLAVLKSAAEETLSPADSSVLNWMLKHRLIEIPDEVTRALKEMQSQAEKIPAPVEVLAMVDGPGLDEPVHIRGSDENFGALVPRRFLLALSGENQPVIERGSGRRELADQVTAPENPLLSRVYVNRLWHHLFGRGIVPSVDDFGVMGQPPSHPELLDWLANDFQQHGGSTKHTLKMLVLSSTYEMTSQLPPDGVEELDSGNRLWHRMPIRRLSAESLRDAMLTVSGRIDLQMYGESVPVHLTEFMEGRGRPHRNGPLDGAGRRSLYQEIRRNFLPPMMLAFDMPSPFSCMGRRAVSNVPSQSLILMNDPFVVEQARLWAQRSMAAESDVSRRIDVLFNAAFSHPADRQQQVEIQEFMKQQARLYGCDENDPRLWADVCHMLFNMKEFLFLL